MGGGKGGGGMYQTDTRIGNNKKREGKRQRVLQKTKEGQKTWGGREKNCR